MKKEIKLGYKVGTDKIVNIKPGHLIVTGITQLSGKTTTLEALIKRSGLKAIIFRTKIGEKSFSEGIETAPFFRDRSDYEFVKSLIEAYSKEKLFLEKGTLMRLCKGSTSLVEIKQRVDEELAEGKLKGLKEEIHTRLQHYLENLIPQIQFANFSNVLNIADGINIMNLERFTEEAQSLIIQSVADEVLKTMKGIIIVIPEAWKFLPQKYNNPCKRIVESYIRQGATNSNYIWIDSQDMAGVDKQPLKQISTWILGYQSERNEVKHTLDQIALPPKHKPKPDDIMNLKKGHFFLSSYYNKENVYVQPIWMKDFDAIRISMGELNVDYIEAPDSLVPNSVAQSVSSGNKAPQEIKFDDSKIKKQLIELRGDFFNKIQEITNAINKLNGETYALKSSFVEVDTDEIASLVLQKMPSVSSTSHVEFDEDAFIKKILAKIPKGRTTYTVSPLEALKKKYLEQTKQILINEINELSDKGKECLKWIEANGKNTTRSEVVKKLWNYTTPNNQNDDFKMMDAKEFTRKDTAGRLFPNLRTKIKNTLATYNVTDDEIEQVYNHILGELL